MCNLFFNNENISLLVKSSLLKNLHYLDLVGVVVVVSFHICPQEVAFSGAIIFSTCSKLF